jgi:hypothetical protein
LLSLSAVTALVSSRVYLDKLPQSPTCPCVRVQQISEQDYHLRGGSNMKRARIRWMRSRAKSGRHGGSAIHGDEAGSGLWVEGRDRQSRGRSARRVSRRSAALTTRTRVVTDPGLSGDAITEALRARTDWD